jgi:hypothetical protein
MFLPLQMFQTLFHHQPPDDELRFETYVGVQTFYKSYNKSGF